MSHAELLLQESAMHRAQGLAVSYQTSPVVTATSVTYAFVQDLMLGFSSSLTASRELAAFDPLTATTRWTVSKCASSAGLNLFCNLPLHPGAS